MQDNDRLLDVFESLFGAEAVGLSDEDGMHTVSAWDSAGHLNLIMAIEAEYGLQFDPADFAELTSIGEIRRRIAGLQG